MSPANATRIFDSGSLPQQPQIAMLGAQHGQNGILSRWERSVGQELSPKRLLAQALLSIHSAQGA
jgi:hypothetical protein